ncbi:YutD family protein [Lentibacillus sp. N15]|uniref:YutD family protein n=1 Tax=Lentibacillus songyuanensis TaxID=3136161 RepID=UPI0031BACA5B
MIELQGKYYEIMEDIKNGYQETAFKERYSDILAKYDFIVGDWGYEQLRLKGFYDDQNTKAAFDTKISALDDYLYEYCNFGCAYFVLKKVDK